MSNLFSLEGRVALVTGSAQGLGNTIARGMKDAGAKVVLSDVNPATLQAAAAELGVPCSRGWVPPMGGATDSAAFTKGGFRSVGITGLNHKLENYYHTRRDSYDNLDPRGLENCYRAGVRTVEKIHNGALDK